MSHRVDWRVLCGVLLAACSDPGSGPKDALPDAITDAAEVASGDTGNPPAPDAAPADVVLADAGPLGGANCSFPACVLALTAGCLPAGTCVLQDSGPAGSVCYANGVSFLETVDRTAGTIEYRVTTTDRTTTCYAAAGTLGSGGTLTYRDGAGRVVATGAMVAGVLSITCTGMAPAVVGSDCLPVPRPVGPTCMPGACP